MPKIIQNEDFNKISQITVVNIGISNGFDKNNEGDEISDEDKIEMEEMHP